MGQPQVWKANSEENLEKKLTSWFDLSGISNYHHLRTKFRLDDVFDRFVESFKIRKHDSIVKSDIARKKHDI